MNKLSWYFNRLRLMSPGEIAYRIKSEFFKKLDRIFLRDFSPNIRLNDKPTHWFFDTAEKEMLVSHVTEKLGWSETSAQAALKHRFSFFSLEEKEAGPTINWHCDYKNMKVAPLKYAKGIDYRDYKKVGDFKYIWEINRHQHLITLAKAYYLTGNETYKREVRAQIMGWITDNPYMKGINWTSALELGVRLISWSWVWFFIGEVDEEWRKEWLVSIYKHCHVISKNFSRYSSANNHLIGEAAGLYIATIVWPFKKRSSKWRKDAFKILTKEIDKQNYDDGVNKEQAISYQQFVLDFFLLSIILGEKNGDKFPERAWDRLQKMFEFIASVMNKNGQLPRFGDSDDGFAVILSDQKEFNPYQSLITTAAALFKIEEFKGKVGGIFDEKSLWLLGLKGAEAFERLSIKAFEPTRAFPKGGYYILGSNFGQENEVLCVFDCGPLGYLSLAAHGHADALSFTLSVEGKEILIDPGTFVYQHPKEWRNYFKGTSAHNTIRINQTDQSVIGGSFMWLSKTKSKIFKYASQHDMDSVRAKHTGYQRLKNHVQHEREITFYKKEKVIKIIDRLTGYKTYRVEQFFHCGGYCLVKEIGPRKYEIAREGTRVVLKIDPKLESFLIRGNINPILGWNSSRFDIKKKSYTIVAENQVTGNVEFETLIDMNPL